jgi:phage tail protein X
MWDSVSLKVYGNEKYIDKLIKANFKYREEAVFPAGIVLNIPEIPEDLCLTEDYQIPKWRTEMK